MLFHVEKSREEMIKLQKNQLVKNCFELAIEVFFY